MMHTCRGGAVQERARVVRLGPVSAILLALVVVPSFGQEAPPPAAARDVGDLAAWRSAANRNDAAGYQEYLDRFPDGLYRSAARDRLAALRFADERDMDYWRSLSASNDPNVFVEYLRLFPSGLFASIARERVAALERGGRAPSLPSRATPVLRLPAKHVHGVTPACDGVVTVTPDGVAYDGPHELHLATTEVRDVGRCVGRWTLPGSVCLTTTGGKRWQFLINVSVQEFINAVRGTR